MDSFVACAKKILRENLAVQPTETLGIIIDVESIISRAFVEAAQQIRLQHKVIQITEKRSASSPIPEVLPLLEACNAIVAPTRQSVSHSPEITKIRKKGARVITLPGVTEEIFLKILATDMETLRSIEKNIHDQIKDAKTVHITTPTGTDLELLLDPKRCWHLSDIVLKKGELDNLPTGELFTAPLETKANGTLVIDRWQDIVTGQNATLDIKNGRIISWSDAAQNYVDTLTRGGENGLVIAEFGIGSNPSHKEPIGNILHDEKIHGTCHIAFGLNTSFGGNNVASVHEDVVLCNPTIIADGKRINL